MPPPTDIKGRSLMRSVVTLWLNSPLSVFSSGASALTVTVS